MTAPERVECDRCGKKVRLRKDGTIAPHAYGRAKTQCEYSEELYARHRGSFRKSQASQQWIAECRCGEFWTGSEYDTVDRAWAEHAGATPFVDRLAAERAAAGGVS